MIRPGCPPPRWTALGLVLLGLVVAGPLTPRAAAQAPIATRSSHAIRWYEPVVVLGAVALASTLDEPIANHFRSHHSSAGDDLANGARPFGSPVLLLPVTAGILVGGVVGKNDAVTRAGARLGASLAIGAVAAEGLKWALGRHRPEADSSAFRFDPFTFDDRAFPSGHATLAFAMATSLSDDIHRPWATAGLYGLATAVAASRLYDQKHWLSDVMGGAALGVTSAKLASGRWRVFGIRPPGFLLGPSGAALGWHFAFHE